jgi:hypothetical protein
LKMTLLRSGFLEMLSVWERTPIDGISPHPCKFLTPAVKGTCFPLPALGFWLTDPCMTIKHLQFESQSAVLSFLCSCKKLSSVHVPSFDSNLNIPWCMSDFPLAVIEGFFLNSTGSMKKNCLGISHRVQPN